MPDIRTPKQSINLNNSDQVSSTREGGLISRPTWTPDDGVARAKEIAEARLKAEQEYQDRLAATHPHRVMMDALATRLTELEKQVEELKNATQL